MGCLCSSVGNARLAAHTKSFIAKINLAFGVRADAVLAWSQRLIADPKNRG